MIHTPKEFSPLLQSLVDCFGKPNTARRIVFFFAAAILTVGDRTVWNVLRLLSLVEPAQPAHLPPLVFSSTLEITAAGRPIRRC